MLVLKKRLILASASPRRQSLLRQIGLETEVQQSGVEEVYDGISSPEQYVITLARQKAQTVAMGIPSGIVIGADTVVVLDDKLLEKPQSRREAVEMLHMLSDRTHSVVTGFTLIDRPSNREYSDFERTEVTFRKLSTGEIEEYVATGSPMDKAGAYGIQDDYGAVFVKRIVGCFYTVVGFPLAKFYMALEHFQKEGG